MIIGIIILCGLLAIVLVQFRKKNKIEDQSVVNVQPGNTDLSASSVSGTVNTSYPSTDWFALPRMQKLQLAVDLCKKLLPVWGQFCEQAPVTYQLSSTLPVRTIKNTMLNMALDEISAQSAAGFPVAGAVQLKRLHGDFVEPVIAIKDGVLALPYPVKKLLLAVYF